MNRRAFLQGLGLAAVAGPVCSAVTPAKGASKLTIIKPPRLKQGDVVGLINPAGATYQSVDLQIARETLAALGLTVKAAPHQFDRYGYLAGKDADRADDVNTMFADSDVNAIMAMRGGWGCARVLPYLDYAKIAAHPKILMGYSDITALLVGIYARTGLVTVHGPVATSTWNSFSVDYVRRVLFAGEAVSMVPPVNLEGNLAQSKDRVETIHGGKARGRVLGGNLSVLVGIIGSDYVPDWDGAILFVEDDGEDIYRIDRMMTQLSLAGVLKSISGFVFGKCTKCGPGEGYGSLTLEEVLRDHIGSLGIPAWYGAMIGHIENKFTVPEGIEVEIDADRGIIRMLEPAVA
jgi:muramoyltetrapeptide carboxypeptidase